MPAIERVGLDKAAGRVLAEAVHADRDFPALARSVRDGFAVRSADVPGTLAVIGEVRAGEQFGGTVGPGQAVEIMTGAPVPAGADAIVMVEHTRRDGSRVSTDRSAEPRQFINGQGCEAARGDLLLPAGTRVDYSGVSVLASAGQSRVAVYRKVLVAILPTGDEIVEVDEVPEPFQVRNSNSWALAAQVTRAGAEPVMIPAARDTVEHTRAMVELALESDLVMLSGGVSAGKYDVVEQVLADFGTQFHFDRVLIQPGQPLVFGSARGRFIFGLPGNPASTMVTFELFARAAIDLASGCESAPLPLTWARLTSDFHHRTGLTRFLPARLSDDGDEITPIKWSGSGDVAAMARANCYLVADSDRAEYARGEFIRLLPK